MPKAHFFETKKNVFDYSAGLNLTINPLVLAIRTLLAGGLVLSGGIQTARAELPIPSMPSALSNTPVDIASHGHASASVAGQTLTIDQSTEKASIDWQSFNIGAGNSVQFNQPSADAVALNNIHQADASKIMGALTANGQVYLVNQNGFVFGQNSQINVNSLVATTLGVSNDTFQYGLTHAFNTNGQAALQGNGEVYLKDQDGKVILDQNGNKIKIEIFIDKNAHIKTNAPGGRVVIAAPVVNNGGVIETPEGQTILVAATDKVYLQEAGANSDMRGLLVEVGTGGQVTNTGKILAEQGNASLMGFAVNQEGIASATTSVNLNGSVRLLAREGIQDPSSTSGKLLPKATLRASSLGDGLGTHATVNLTHSSQTVVDLDSDKSTTAIDAQAQSKSKIEISGHDVYLRNGATVKAHSGNIGISALDDPTDSNAKGNARIFIESGAVIDASGVKNVQVGVDKNIVAVELRKNELRDAPLQRNGVLYGQTVYVDVRSASLKYSAEGTLLSASIPLADITGAVQRIARNIDERSISGGAVNLSSTGDVITQSGSLIDFSGGSLAYQGGSVKTTQLLSGSQVYDIATADPNRHYDSILGLVIENHPQWGYTDTWSIPGLTSQHFESSYTQGAEGGSLAISAYSALLNGQLNGTTLAGDWQRSAASLSAGSSLAIDLSNNNLLSQQAVIFAQNVNSANIGARGQLPRKSSGSSDVSALMLSAGLFKNSGISAVSIKTNGSISLQKSTTLALPVLGSLNLSASQFDIEGTIIAPSGSVNLKPISVGGIESPTAITLGDSAKIDVSGLWVNDVLDAQAGKSLGIIASNGGVVSLSAEQGDLNLQTGSVIDVSGGAYLNGQSQVSAGKGGSISLTAATHDSGGKLASLLLNGSLAGWSLNQGGTLALSSNQVVIGQANDVPVHAGESFNPLVLKSNFFQQGGFSGYTLTANHDGLIVADGQQINLQQKNLQLDKNFAEQVTGNKLTDFSQPVLLPDTLRKPTNLTLAFSELTNQNASQSLSIGKGALIQTDPGALVALRSDTSVFMDGSINAPAGEISISINTPSSVDKGYFASQGIWLGASSQLLANGVFQPTLNNQGLHTGNVLAGGAVSLSAQRGYIVARRGSVINVSGTSHSIDYQIPTRLGTDFIGVSETVASQGGAITLQAGEGILADNTLLAKSGGSGVAGGSLSVLLSPALRNKPQIPVTNGLFPDDVNKSLPVSIDISADKSAFIPNKLVQGGALSAQAFSGKALFSAPQINHGGFDSVLLKTDVLGANGNYAGAIQFKGSVSLTANRQIILDTPTIKTNGGLINLNTAYAKLGSSQSRIDTDNGDGSYASTLAPSAHTGTGQFTVSSKAIDLIGGLSFDGFNQVNFNSVGDLRMVGIRTNPSTKDYLGALNVAGDLNIRASQVYPATLTNYTISDNGQANATVTLQKSGQVPTPVYSAGGNLTINAPNINQQGVLEVPLGSLALNAKNNLTLAKGSVTSVSGNGLTVPFGQGSAGLNWLYPLDSTGSTNVVISNPPDKHMALNGKTVNLKSGAKVDLTGGGDLYAYEFITGPGGSIDVLSPHSVGYQQNFAVIPALGNALTPYDPQLLPSSGVNVGDSVYLGAGSALSAGWYTLLPAHYALLPGAFLITPQANMQNSLPGMVTSNLAGSTIVAGRYGSAMAGTAQSQWQGFAVEAGSLARTRSQYTDYSANNFFANVAGGAISGSLPNSAGSLAMTAQTGLTLNAQLSASPVENGRGGQVDISANHLMIVARRQDFASTKSGIVSLLADDLNKLNAPSLLLGGVRSKSKNGQQVSVTSQTLILANHVDLQGNELILAAKDEVLVKSGAVIESKDKNSGAGVDLTVSNPGNNSDGALVRVSSAEQINVSRDHTVTGNTGTLVVEKGATLKSSNSLLLDSTKDTVFDGKIDMQGGSLALNARNISLGNAPVDTAGLVLSDTQLKLDELKLTSAHNVDIYGGLTVNAGNIVIDAAQIDGFDNTGQTASLTANVMTLTNSHATANGLGDGKGRLNLLADTLQLGSGNYAINGFSQVTVKAKTAIEGIGQTLDPVTGQSALSASGKLNVGGDLTLEAGHFIGSAGATTGISATGYQVNLSALGEDNASWTEGLGASWSITGDKIISSGRFDLPSGSLSLTALKGDITLSRGSRIDTSGRTVTFDNLNRYTPAGNVLLSAQEGNVTVAEGASVNVAGAIAGGKQASSAGLLAVNTPKGQLFWNGAITALANAGVNSTFKQGQFQLNANSFGVGGLSALTNNLALAGFTESLVLAQQQGDISLASTDSVKAHQFSLSADQGQITLNGTINASGAKAGEVSLYGHNGIVLGETANILATAGSIGAEGGKVTLDTVHRDDAGSGLLDLSARGGQINVSAGAQGNGGSVHLNTGRDDSLPTIHVTDIHTHIIGADAQKIALSATRVYDGQTVIKSADIKAWQNDTSHFMANEIFAGNYSGANVQILPGLEIRSSSDLTLANQWDLMAWRYSDNQGKPTLPGFLTLRAEGNLNINATLTDGFATDYLPGQSSMKLQDVLQTGYSWSYNLIAKGNINLANSYLAPDPSGFGPNQTSQVMVRTGTGSIDINAGNNLYFVPNLNDPTASAAVYTMGTTALYTRGQLLAGEVPGVPAKLTGESDADYLNRLDPVQMNTLLRYGYFNETLLGLAYTVAEYPTQGGAINIQANGNIIGVNTGQQISDWLVRSGGITANNRPTAWGINVSGDRSDAVNGVSSKDNRYFNQNIGSLAGGNVTINAGGNIKNLSVMLPTTGKPFGKVSTANNQWTQTGTIVNGGGDLQLKAGRSIAGGEYFVGRGNANITAGGSVGTSNNGLGALLELGDGTVNVQARQNITIASVLNPTLLKQTNPLPSSAGGDSQFFTYSDTSAVNLASLAGNTILQNNINGIRNQKNADTSTSGFEYAVYPGTLSATAYSGDVRIENSMTLTPSPKGQFSLLAGQSINTDSNAGQLIAVNMSDADIAFLPTVNNPTQNLYGSISDGLIRAQERLDGASAIPSLIHAINPVHTADTSVPTVIAKLGDIAFADNAEVTFYLPQASYFSAGRDINNLSLAGQNLSVRDMTQIKAGRDINFDALINDNGIVQSNDKQIELAGSGQLQIQAGGSINLGGSAGINTIGNTKNTALSSAQGADISLLAGIGDKVDYAGFITKYFTLNSDYLKNLQLLDEKGSVLSLSAAEKLFALEQLPTSKQQKIVLSALANEIKLSAEQAAIAPESARKAIYQQGFTAINTLFPGSQYHGDLSLVFSQIKTLAGGDINMAIPGGAVNVGLAGQLGGIAKGADQLGIVAQQAGDINAITHGDFNVNQSRVFTMGGGDIAIWSSTGNIDAGKGAKSAISAPAPIVSVDSKGNIVTTFPPIVSGSGIQTINPQDKTKKQGNVYLAAPVGVIDAGEAGISGGKIVIAATAVVGASNISASGGSVGVPTAVSAPVTPSGAASAAASASKQATTGNEEDDEKDNDNSKKKSTVSLLSTDVVGYGSCSVADVRAGKSGCGG